MGFPKRLARAKSMAVGWDNYVNYLSNLDDRPDKVGQGKAREKGISVYIKPFGKVLSAKVLAEGTANESLYNTLAATATKYAPRALPAEHIGENIGNFTPARVIKRINVDPKGVRATSNRTKLPYLKYGGTSSSIAFGKSVDGDKIEEVYAAFKATDTTATTRWSLVSEKIRGS